MKSWLRYNCIEIYSRNNEGKYVIVGRFIRTIRNNIYKHRTAVSKTVYIGKLVKIVGKYNNHRIIKMKLVNLKVSVHGDFSVELNDKDPKFKVGEHVTYGNTEYKV